MAAEKPIQPGGKSYIFISWKSEFRALWRHRACAKFSGVSHPSCCDIFSWVILFWFVVAKPQQQQRKSCSFASFLHDILQIPHWKLWTRSSVIDWVHRIPSKSIKTNQISCHKCLCKPRDGAGLWRSRGKWIGALYFFWKLKQACFQLVVLVFTRASTLFCLNMVWNDMHPYYWAVLE